MGSSSATRRTSKQTALEPFSLPKVVEEVVVVIKKLLRQNTFEKRLFLKEAKIRPIHPSHSPNERVLRKSISHDAGVNLGLFGINEHRLSSLRDFLELDLSQPTSSMLLDSRVYTQKWRRMLPLVLPRSQRFFLIFLSDSRLPVRDRYHF